MTRFIDDPPPRQPTLEGTVKGGWWHPAEAAEDSAERSGRIVCDLCPRECHLKPGDRGFCFVRENQDGQMLLTTYGRSTGFCIDPIEKKPLNHFYPGSSVLSFGTAGCNLGCKFCQNWDISKSREIERLSESATPESIAAAAQSLECRSVAFTYNDPVIWAEYAIDTARACRQAGVKTVAVTAGYITPQARPAFFEYIDAANVDLKAFTEEFYFSLTSAHIEPVLDTLRWLRHESDVWFELTNLIIPQANDSDDELRRMSAWVLEELGDNVPVHFTAFHPDFRMRDRPATPHETLLRAYEIARREGLKYVYVGNVHDVRHQSTYCAGCGELIIERDWHQLGVYALEGPQCRHCGESIPGRFDSTCGDWGRRRLPVQMATFRDSKPRIQSTPEAEMAAESQSSGSAVQQDTSSSPSQTSDARPELNETQRQATFQLACRALAAEVRGEALTLDDPSIAGADKTPVMGSFVTAKRQGQLRGCCGMLGQPMRLFDAVAQAAKRTGSEDPRMPPIAASELPHLEIDVTLLHHFEQLTQAGNARIEAVEVGTHGLQIQRGQQSGLLLPSVAIEHDLSPEAFLRQVCQKAGLPTNAWQDEQARVFTFQVVSIDGNFAESDQSEGEAADERSIVSEQELQMLAQHTGRNIILHLQGATPSYYLPGCSDANVQGLVLALHFSDGDPLYLHRFSFRPAMPMQSTLFSMSEAAAQALRRRSQSSSEPTELRVGLAVLYDAAMNGTVSQPDLRGIATATRGVFVTEGAKRGWRFDPELSPQQLLDDTAASLSLRLPERAQVFSLACQSTEPRLVLNAVPQASRGSDVREPGVAGTFYPADADELDQLVDQLLQENPADAPADSAEPTAERRDKRAVPAAMVPHAGLTYSGKVAAAVYNQIEIPATVIVLSPKHTREGVEWAVAPHKTWRLPGRELASDPELAERLAERIDGLELDANAHRKEHGIEVELPFLARLAPDARVVGIAMGSGDLERCREFARGLAEVLREMDPKPLLLISSDMNHFAPELENRELDELALQALETLDTQKLYDTVTLHQISMCGVLPAIVVLDTLKELGMLSGCERVAYTTSAETTGDTSRVVGYAGMLFSA